MFKKIIRYKNDAYLLLFLVLAAWLYFSTSTIIAIIHFQKNFVFINGVLAATILMFFFLLIKKTLDLSTNLGNPDWFALPGTTLGIQGTWRSLDEFSPRYSPLAAPEFGDPPISPVGFPNGSEWEIRTYLHVNIGN